ncbi:MAG: cytochrome c3 family protein [bacterium]
MKTRERTVTLYLILIKDNLRRMFHGISRLNVIISLIIAILFLSSGSDVFAQIMRNSAKECAICHYRWLDQFYVEGRGSDLAEYQRERVAGSEMICYSCHNGIMVDSRKRFWANRGHRVNMVPSDKVQIPPELPLGKKGEVICATCHTAHGVADERRYEVTIYLRFCNQNSEMCAMCHQGKTGGKKSGNHPINVSSIKVPQKIFDHYGRIGTKGEIICESCHTVHGVKDKNLLVIPDRLDDNTYTSELCEACHGSNPSLPNKGIGMGSHPVDLVPQKATLPKQWEGGLKTVTGIGGQMICESCHWPHNAAKETSILAKKGKEPPCLDCHKNERRVSGTDHDLRITAPAEIGEKGICAPCHIPHNSGPIKLCARKDGGKQVQTVSALCISCHKSEECAKAKQVGKFTHPGEVDPKATGIKTDLPLYLSDGKISEDGKLGCATCHSAHQWNPEIAAQGSGKNEEGNNKTSFLRKIDTEDSSLCTGCHKDKELIKASEHDMELAAPNELNILGQTRKSGGLCSPCHLVHNGKNIKMWARETFLSDQSQSSDDSITVLCESCHDKGRVGEKKLIGAHTHPTAKKIDLVGGYKGDLPLFFYNKQGNKVQEGGEVTCASCHNVHKWQPDKNKKGPGKLAEGDRRDSFLRVADNADSKLCISCHLSKSDLKDTKHDMRISASKEVNANGERVRRSGICGACHLPHQGYSIRMFARKPLDNEGKGPISALCDTCHNEKGPAQKKTIKTCYHPQDKTMKESVPLPLYDTNGTKTTAEGGKLSCSTCHDVHIWGLCPEATENKNSEGYGKSSFLRLSTAPNALLCVTCHKEQKSILNTDHDLVLTAPDEKNMHGVTAADCGPCSACHVLHNANKFRLWGRTIDTPVFGEGPVGLLCRSCHSLGRVGGKKTLSGATHPVDISISQSKLNTLDNLKISLPLYTAGSLNPMDQRIESSADFLTCQSCHQVHKWDEMGTMPGKKEIEGTIDNSFLRLTKGFAGSMCLDCHQDKKYILDSEHDMRRFAPKAVNLASQTADQAGVCSPCHMVHNAPSNQILWARSLEGEQDFMLGTCVNCHKKGGCASAKDVFIGLHPSSFVYTGKIMQEQLFQERKVNIYYPLYDKLGNLSPVGFVTCPTCHNAHQWDPIKKIYSADKETNLEGDPTNSFLRNKGAAFSICLDCHGFDALLKYKGYHLPKEWKSKYWRGAGKGRFY